MLVGPLSTLPSLWLLGLARLHQPPTATRLLMVALSLWMTILVAELTVIPMLVSRLSGPSGRVLEVLGSAWFCFALVAGYLAMALVWLAVGLMAGQQSTPWLGHWGRIGGVVGLLGDIYPVFVSSHALYVLAITAAVPYLWTLSIGGYTIIQHRI